MITRKNYYMLDITKFIFALLLISAHFAAERGNFKGVIDLAFSLYIFAVPFFFTCSGFLFFNKLNKLSVKDKQKNYLISYEKRIFIMYGLWSVLYYIFILCDWFLNGTTLSVVFKQIHTSIVFTTYATIWYLPALGFSIAFVYFIKNLKAWKLILIMVLLYIFSAAGYTYRGLTASFEQFSEIIDVYSTIFVTTRNGLFNGVPFVIVGLFIANAETEKKSENPSVIPLVAFLIVTSIISIAEAFIAKKYFIGDGPGVDVLFFMLPTQYFLVKSLIAFELDKKKIYTYFRKLSILMFTTQRIFLTALPTILPNEGYMNYFSQHSYIGLILIIFMIIAFDLCIIYASKKIKFLNNLL